MASYLVNLVTVHNKKGKSYRLDYRIGKKRIREYAGPTRKEAEMLRAKKQHELLFERNKLTVPDKSVKPLPSLIDEYLKLKERELRAPSLGRYRNYLEPLAQFFQKYFPDGYADVRRIDKAHVQEYIEHIQNGKKPWAPKTMNGFIRLAKSMFKTAVDEGYLNENPFENVKEFRLPSKGLDNHFPAEELARIWKEVEPHWQPCLEFIYHTGLRKGEMINLLWENVDFKNRQIAIVSLDDWETKTGRNRTIPLDRRALEILESMRGKHERYVFTSKTGKKIHPDKPYHALKKALDTLGLEGDVHKLRHTFASHLSMRGVDTPTIMQLMGHTDIKTTLIYARPDVKHLQGVVALLNPTEKEEAA